MVIKKKTRTSLLIMALLAVTGWVAVPFGVQAETSGSYAHPDIPGPDEGNTPARQLREVVPADDSGGGAALGAPEVKTEGSTRKGGYGPGAHPGSGKEGSGSKRLGYDHGKKGHGGYGKHHGGKHHAEGSGKKGYGHGKMGHGGYDKHHAKSHHGEGSGKGYGHHSGHSKKYSQGGGSHGGHGYSKHGSGHHGKGHKHNPFKHILKYREKLGLTPDQVKDIMRMRFDWEKQRIRLGADLMIAHMELDRQVHSGVLDEPKMHELAKLIGGLKMQKAQIMVEAKIALLKTLTEEQRKKIADIHGDH